MIGRTVSRYQITERLGQGGMGVVYKALDTRLDRTVALKFLPAHSLPTDDDKARFYREARAAAKLNHPHIAHVYEIDETDDGQAFIAMEYVEGQTLAEKIQRGPLKLQEAVTIAIQVADGLEAAHEAGIVHRDVKSSNVMLTEKGQVKIMDFGLAKTDAATLLTQEGTALGTVAYMSPEQARGETVDHRSDIWSLGVVLYEMVSGRRPFEGDYEQAVIYSILNEDSEPLTAIRTGVTMALERVVTKCLSKDPALRFQHVDEVAVDLRTIETGGVDRSRVGPISRTVDPSARIAPARLVSWRRALPWTLAAVLGVAAIGSWLWPRQAPQPAASRPAHLQIVLPPGLHVAVDTQYPALALSPDGTRLVFVGDEGGIRRLYLRDLATPEIRVMAGTEGAAAPFFSPQGDYVGFFAGGVIKKIPVGGGMAISVHDATGTGVNRGASWSKDDAVIYAPSPNSGLHRGSVAGDTERPIGAWTELTDPAAPYAWPHALPGGDHVLFTDLSRDRLSEARVALLSIQEGEIKPLVNGGTNPRYSPTGHLLFVRDGALYGVSFDLRRHEVTGGERKLLDGVLAEENGAAQYTVGGGGTLAYIAGGLRSNEDELVWVDRPGNAETLLDNGRSFQTPRLSPDGTRLAVTSPTGTNFDIWLLDLNRATFDPLTSHPGEDLEPVWSPNGEHLALASEINEDESGGGPALAWMPGLKTPPVLLVRSPGIGNWEFPSSWSPDGRWLVYNAERGGEKDIWLMPMDETKEPIPFLQGPAKETAGMISPNGRWIAYVSDVSGRDEVYVQTFPDPGERIPISPRGGTEPVWRRDGRELFYREGDRLMAVRLGDGPALDPKPPEVLFEGRFRKTDYGAENAEYDVSPDGSRFVMVRMKNPVTPTVIHVVLNWPEALQVPSADQTR